MFVYIGAKVCQVLLHYISFAIRREKCGYEIGHEPSGFQIVKLQKLSVFIILSCWINSSNGNRLSDLIVLRHLFFANSIFNCIICDYERYKAPMDNDSILEINITKHVNILTLF